RTAGLGMPGSHVSRCLLTSSRVAAAATRSPHADTRGGGSVNMVDRSAVCIASRARHGLRTRVSTHPALYLAFARRKYPGPSPKVVGRDTQLVIDGYTRSATTFA